MIDITHYRRRMKEITMQTKTLFISAGHSDTDPGAVGNGLTEADAVLEMRDAICDELDAKGIVHGRDGRRGENLPLRNAMTMAAKHDVAIELHLNAFTNPQASGVETLSSTANKRLGTELCRAISATLGIANRGAKGEGAGQHSRLGFVSTGGGIIVETFFVTNPSDVAAYQRNKDRMVEAIASILINEVAPKGIYGE